MFTFKVLAFLWPFVKEMILGKKSLKESVQTNKARVLLTALIFSSLALNIFIVPKLITISKDYIALDKKYKSVEATMISITHMAEKCKTPDPVPEELPVVKITAPVVVTKPVAITPPKRQKSNSTEQPNRYSRVLSDFDKMKQKEERETK